MEHVTRDQRAMYSELCLENVFYFSHHCDEKIRKNQQKGRRILWAIWRDAAHHGKTGIRVDRFLAMRLRGRMVLTRNQSAQTEVGPSYNT